MKGWMNHDYAHCADMTDECPKSCFRAQLTRDLKAGMIVSFMSMKNTDMCPLTKKDRKMELLIKIPEKIYKAIQDNTYCGISNSDMYDAIRSGTPLPKGHGDLIDACQEMRLMQSCDYDTYEDYLRAFDMLDYAPTIIEEDKEVDE